MLENTLNQQHQVRVIENCLNGRRTVWDDPFKLGRNGLQGLEQVIEIHSPLALVILFLGTNDLQSMHPHTSIHAAHGVQALVNAIRRAPIEPGMPQPPILIVAPPPAQVPKGDMQAKFQGVEKKCVGMSDAYQVVAIETGCHFFDAGGVVSTSSVDGVHLDKPQHHTLGKALAVYVAELLVESFGVSK